MSARGGRRRGDARLAVSIGCPCGVGPEVSLVAATELPPGARVVLVGDRGALVAAARTRGVDPKRIVAVASEVEAWACASSGAIAVLEPRPPLASRDRAPGRPGRAAGAAQLAWIDLATDLVARGEADALVTGPVSKDAIARSGTPGSRGFLGHTEHLAARLGAPEVTMAFYVREGADRGRARRRADPLRALITSLVTTHLPIARVARAVTAVEVARAAYFTARFAVDMRSARSPARPVVAIAALNPHAGEGGLLGDEERVVIAPGIAAARRRLARARVDVELVGPVPAETAFRLASGGTFAAVVAMYHDQATIPMKLLGFGDAVNVSLGLPIVRTSVDHGTAYDRAGKGTADARGMIEAMRLAVTLSRACQ